MGRKKKALRNLTVSLLLEIVNIFSGLILPRLIIGFYGSPTNGLINSITSFIGYVALLQSGVGSVIKAALYKPLAEGNKEAINDIVFTLESFFKKIALISTIYCVLLACIYPFCVLDEFDYWFTASLIIFISLSTIAQYLWGMPYQLLLEADQKGYVYSLIQTVVVLVNTSLSIILINKGLSIQVVKLVTSAVYIARPVIIRYYTRNNYNLKLTGNINYALLKSRWDGFAQAIAYYIHSKTDIFVLTIFAVLSDVSVYSIYALVISVVTIVIKALDQAVSPAFGNIIAKEEGILNDRFEIYCFIIHNLSAVLFGATCISIMNFIRIYTRDISDYNYIRILFGAILITSEYVYCFRLPYNSIIYAAGKIKETRNSAILEAAINIVLSIIFVKIGGMEGVALATLIAMVYRMLSLINYLKKDVLYLSTKKEIKQIFISFIDYVPSIIIMIMIERKRLFVKSFISWFIFAFIITILYVLYIVLVNLIFNRTEFKRACLYLLGR